ncbi:MAG: substrate-binding domain-containing protein [Chthoniobacterales bacterium]
MLGSSDFDRCIYESISEYLSEHTSEIDVIMELDYFGSELPSACKGIITRILDVKEISLFRSYGIPVINISGQLESPGFPSVISDSLMAGCIAAEHLLSRRFHHFAYYGQKSVHYSDALSRSFKQAIAEAGFHCAFYFDSWVPSINVVTDTHRLNLRQWIASLSKPIGILCTGDYYAWELSKACEALNLIVGRDVGVLGVGNWAFFCRSRKPQLSSLNNRPDLIGYESAALMMRLLHGEPPPSSPILIPPTIIARASSDIFVTADSYVAAAIQFIQDHIGQPLPPQEVFNHIPLSRSALERRFRKQLNYTVLATIHLLKVDHIKHLLVSTSCSIEQISNACGFSSAPYMTTLFREKVGTTPSEYRHQFQRSVISKS